MSKLMIIGAGPLQLPAYDSALEMGIEIVAIDRDPNAPGMRLAHSAYAVDTRDASGAIEVAKKEQIDGVMTLCTDYPVRTVAAIAAALDLPGLDAATALRATHKGMMREAFRSAGAPSPRFARVRSLAEAHSALLELGLPCVIKPTSSSGSRGIYKVESVARLAIAYAHAMRFADAPGEIVVEQYVDGPEVSVETVSSEETHHVLAITDKLTTGDPHWVELGHSQPSALPESTLAQIEDCAKRGLEALGIRNCPAHVEIKVARCGPTLIEIGARLGGDFISTDLTLGSTGISMPRAAIDLALGHTPNITRRWQRGSAVRYLIANPGRVTSVDGVQEASQVAGVDSLQIYVNTGDVVGALSSSLDRIGHVIATGATREDAVRSAETAVRLLRIRTAAEATL